MIAAIIPARLASTRLPGKVLKEINDRTLLAHVIARAKVIPGINAIIVATTTDDEDGAVAQEATREGARVFRGDVVNVLDRTYQAAREHGASTIVRLAADCPLLDPVLAGQVLARFTMGDCDYASNVFPATYPDGLDVEVLSFSALERAWKDATTELQREAVTPYIWERPDEFRCGVVTHRTYLRHLKWSVDDAEDFARVEAIFTALGVRTFDWGSALAVA